MPRRIAETLAPEDGGGVENDVLLRAFVNRGGVFAQAGAAGPDVAFRDDLEPGTWYRLPDEEGATQVLAKSFDPDWVTKLILSSRAIVQNGREDIGGGVFATHFFVTPDPEAMVDVAMESLPEAMKSSGTDVREAIRSEIPSRMHYWVDDAGYLVKEDDGFQVKTYHSFGEPLDLPEFDEAAVEALPGA